MACSSSSETRILTRAQERMAATKMSLPMTSSFFWSSPVVLEEPAKPVSCVAIVSTLRTAGHSIALEAHVNERSSSDVVRNALECKLKSMTEQGKISCGLLVFGLFFCEESRQRHNLGVDALGANCACVSIAV